VPAVVFVVFVGVVPALLLALLVKVPVLPAVPLPVPAVVVVPVPVVPLVVPPVLVAILPVVVFVPVVSFFPDFVASRSSPLIFIIVFVPALPALMPSGRSFVASVVAVARGVAGVAVGASFLIVIVVCVILGMALQLVVAVGVVVLQPAVAALPVLHLQDPIKVGLLVHST
jgi:hypothetical protein